MKTCKICKTHKPLTDFHKDKKSSDGHFSYCKVCGKEKSRAKYLANKDSIIAKQKAYQAANQDKIKARVEARKDKIREYQKQYKIKNREKLLKYKAENREHIAKYNKEYKARNRDSINRQVRVRVSIDPQYKISINVRKRLGEFFRFTKKPTTTNELLGCSWSDLMAHLSSKFYNHPETNEAMSFDNYGKKWHIDHIKPLSKFNLLDESELRQAAHYTNLQPMWAEENLRKNNKYEE